MPRKPAANQKGGNRETAPDISIIIAIRGQTHGNGLLRRLGLSLNALTTQLEESAGSYEVLVVNWNPPRDGTNLKDDVKWPQRLQHGNIRIVEVPELPHKQFYGAQFDDFLEWQAKNVGVRRARAEYALATNADDMFNKQLVSFLVSHKLSRGRFYRVDRYEVNEPVPETQVDQQLRFCEEHTSSVNVRGGVIRLRRPPVGFGRIIFHMQYWSWEIQSFRRRKSRIEDLLHTNASGDFMLMHRDHWFELRGYPEDLRPHTHVDGYLVVMAASAGLRQVVLPTRMRIYHQPHKHLITSTGYDDWHRESSKMLEAKKPTMFNGEDWGLADASLNEYSP